MVTVRHQGLDELIDDFDDLPRRVDEGARKRVEDAAANVQKVWRARWTGHAHLPHLPHAVTYDVHETPAGFSAEVGPDKRRRQGPLGNIIEFGTLNNAPIPGGVPALDQEEPRFVQTMQDLAETALNRAD